MIHIQLILKDQKEFHDTLNQNLSTEAIHESIHYDNPVLDQYQVATRYEYTGSYIDIVHKGKIGIPVKSIDGIVIDLPIAIVV